MKNKLYNLKLILEVLIPKIYSQHYENIKSDRYKSVKNKYLNLNYQ